MAVDLPPPFGPNRARVSPRATSRSEMVEAPLPSRSGAPRPENRTAGPFGALSGRAGAAARFHDLNVIRRAGLVD